MSAHLKIGDLAFDVTDEGDYTPDGITWKVTISSSRKVDKKVADKDDDATVTDKGREVREVVLELSWRADTESSKIATPIVEALDPSNPKPGDPPAFAYEHEGLDIAKLKNTRAVKWEKADGPNPDDASGKVIFKLTGSSWTKPKPSAGAGTPGKSKGFVLASETGKVYGTNTLTVKGPQPAKPGVPKA